MRLKLAIAIIIAICFSGLLIQPSAKAAGSAFSYSNLDVQSCEIATVEDFCLNYIEADPDLDGTFTSFIDEPLILFSARGETKSDDLKDWSQMVIGIYSQQQQLNVILPANTPVRFSLNTRDWKPPTSNYIKGNLSRFNVEEINGEWNANYEVSTVQSPDARSQLSIVATGVVAKIPETEDEMRRVALWKAFYGNWISTNCSANAVFEKFELQWRIDSSGPALDLDGNPSHCFLKAFFPYDSVVLIMGTDPESMGNYTSAIRIDGKLVTPETTEVTRVLEPTPGIIVEIPNFSLNSNQQTLSPLSNIKSKLAPLTSNKFNKPKHIIKQKGKPLRAPKITSIRTNKSSIRLVFTKVNGAKSYGAICVGAKGYKFKEVKSTTVSFKNLKKGYWGCQVRAIKRAGGYWSDSHGLVIK